MVWVDAVSLVEMCG